MRWWRCEKHADKALIWKQSWASENAGQWRTSTRPRWFVWWLAQTSLKRRLERKRWVDCSCWSGIIKLFRLPKVNANLPVGLCMIRAIQEFHRLTGHKIGLKPAGGVKTVDDAIVWLKLVKETLGDDYFKPELFRFGASGLLDDIEKLVVNIWFFYCFFLHKYVSQEFRIVWIKGMKRKFLKNFKALVCHRRVLHDSKFSAAIVISILTDNVAVSVFLFDFELPVLAGNRLD